MQRRSDNTLKPCVVKENGSRIEIGSCEQSRRHSSSGWHLTTSMNSFLAPFGLSWTSSSLDPYCKSFDCLYVMSYSKTTIFQSWCWQCLSVDLCGVRVWNRFGPFGSASNFFFETFTAVASTSMELRLRKDRPVTVRQVDQGKDLDMTTGRAEFKMVAIYGCWLYKDGCRIAVIKWNM